MLDWGVIQAGGKSSRMGKPKAWLEVAGRPLIERPVHAARPVVHRLGVALPASPPPTSEVETWAKNQEVALLNDRLENCGPLGGLFTALGHCRDQTDSALILACDLPSMTTDFLSLIAEIHKRDRPQITIATDQHDRPQPLAAIYETSCLPVIEELLAANRFRVDGLFQSTRLRWVKFEEYSQLPGARTLFRNLNTPAEFAAFNAEAQQISSLKPEADSATDEHR